jgi:CheY-like chemotaxis protein
LVDDDLAFLNGLARLLALSGYDVVPASNAHAALRLCKRLRPALVVSDYEMPGADGVELAGKIAKQMGEEAPPLLLLTGASELPKTPHAVAVVKKTVRPDDLITVIESLLP